MYIKEFEYPALIRKYKTINNNDPIIKNIYDLFLVFTINIKNIKIINYNFLFYNF